MPARPAPAPLAALVATAALATACVTIQVYFPAARIQSLTEQIEAEVQRRGQPPAPAPVEAPESAPAGDVAAPPAEPPASPPRRRSNPPRADLGWVELALGVRPALADADVPDPGISSPAIRRLIESRAARVRQVNEWKGRGVLGEGKDALLVLRTPEAVSDLGERAALRRLVDAENDDRHRLFEEIAAAEGVDRSQLPRIQATYAQTLRRHARPGDWLQAADGSWEQQPAQ